MNRYHPLAAGVPGALAFLLVAAVAHGQDVDEPPTIEDARTSIEAQVLESVQELTAFRESVQPEKLELMRQLGEIQAQVAEAEEQYRATSRTLELRTIALQESQMRIDQLEETKLFLDNLFDEYRRNLRARLNVTEREKFDPLARDAGLAMENDRLSLAERYAVQLDFIDVALRRLETVAGGARFSGRAVAPSGLLTQGSFVLAGPWALFRSADGQLIGTADEQVGVFTPIVTEFDAPEAAEIASAAVAGSGSTFPVDTSLGNAHKVASTNETFVEHVKKGGPVMIPIFAMAAAALFVALLKWLTMAFVRVPSRKKLQDVYDAVEKGDTDAVGARVSVISGPVGHMLSSAVDNLGQPRELIEEVMFEHVMTRRLKLNSFLPFIAICAASAPLMGLLGTVTGIINTFELINIFGSGDVKSLSGGISEALITTKFGLVVAIPSLLLHAFLFRKARGIVGKMETAGVGFMNALAKAREFSVVHEHGGGQKVEVDPGAVRAEVQKILGEMLGAESNGLVATVNPKVR